VAALQTALKECNFASSLRADGEFGSLTENALIYAQDRRGTDPDGIYGPDTRVALAWPSYYNGTLTGCAPSPS
jgi:peptidoglycan hydrolase-like protein with peptidoglycan-binding domain